MQNTFDFDDDDEERLLLFHKRCVATLSRNEASERSVRDALSVTQDTRLARVALEFTVEECNDTPHRWLLCDGLGKAVETYVSSLREMEDVRLANSEFKGLTSDHHRSFEAVKAAALELQALGWPVNWEQNVQAILELTEYGLRDGRLIHCYEDSSATVVLKDEMLALGSTAFYRQKRAPAEGVTPLFKAVTISAANKARYDNVELHLCREDEEVPTRFRYCSDWLENGSCRIAI